MRLLKLLFLALCVMLAASACGSDPVHYRNVQNPNYGQADFDRDSYQCVRENQSQQFVMIGRIASTSTQVDENMAQACMRARGWQAYAAPAAAPRDDGWMKNAALAAYNSGDYTTALRLWRSLADQGNAGAQFSLGFMYAKGEGVPQDYAAAVAWYRKAADQGHAGAQNNLGNMYLKGEGVPQNYAAAVSWFRKSAEQGNANAQTGLGFMYEKGQGVPKDLAAAVAWYRKAAAGGDAMGQNNLGGMYNYGWGVPRDLVQARHWYNLAAAQGNALAKQNLARFPAQ